MKKSLLIVSLILIILLILFQRNEIHRSVKLSVVGDVLLDRGVKTMIVKHGLNYPYEKVSEILNQAQFAQIYPVVPFL